MFFAIKYLIFPVLTELSKALAIFIYSYIVALTMVCTQKPQTNCIKFIKCQLSKTCVGLKN